MFLSSVIGEKNSEKQGRPQFLGKSMVQLFLAINMSVGGKAYFPLRGHLTTFSGPQTGNVATTRLYSASPMLLAPTLREWPLDTARQKML